MLVNVEGRRRGLTRDSLAPSAFVYNFKEIRAGSDLNHEQE
jgi:hypothetical protein